MPTNLESLVDVEFSGCAFGVSARRFYEHIAFGQVNPFRRPVEAIRSVHQAGAFVDVIHIDTLGAFSLTGLTLDEIDDDLLGRRALKGQLELARRAACLPEVKAVLEGVATAAKQFTGRLASRHSPRAFLPAATQGDPFGVPLIRSRIGDYLQSQIKVKAPAEQWIGTIDNLANKGLREEEVERSGVPGFLAELIDTGKVLPAHELSDAINWSALRLSVIPNIKEARNQLHFQPVQPVKLAKVKGAKPQAGQRRHLRLFDRVMGYRIEEVEHAALWGADFHWQVVTFDGRVLRNLATRRATFESRDDAIARAQQHAREVMPKLLASERWIDWSWTGGEEYREWLITLPFFPKTYLSSHFSIRNILAHVRCDFREGENGERVLMLHEVQSDWMQQARELMRDLDEEDDARIDAPFLKEWPSLSLKLMLLHASHISADALGWTTGKHQEQRYKGLGKEGLKELYDHTLPREAKRILKPFGLTCEMIEVYVPDNFLIQRREGAYRVCTLQGKVLAVAATFEEARAMLPDGAHERLHEVHGVRMNQASRAAILKKGFFAWG